MRSERLTFWIARNRAMELFDFNIIALSVAMFLLVGGYAWRQYSVALGCMLAGVIGLLLLILYNIRVSVN